MFRVPPTFLDVELDVDADYRRNVYDRRYVSDLVTTCAGLCLSLFPSTRGFGACVLQGG